MAPVLRIRVDPRQRVPQELSGAFPVRVAPQQHAPGHRELVAVAAGQHVQVNVEHRLKAARPSLIPMFVASANTVARAARAIRWPMVTIWATVSGWGSVKSTGWRLGI